MAIIPGAAGNNIDIDTPEKQKARKMAVILAGVILLIAGVVYLGFFSGSGAPTPPLTGQTTLSGNETIASAVYQDKQKEQILESLEKVNLSNAIFADKNFQSLKASAKLPVVIGEKGRENPFAEF